MVEPSVSQALPQDQAVRDGVINPQQSFIVQAPAGSGKTELLMQRFLALLGQVGRPEEILALTFTKKAASEMRARILNALRAAAVDAPMQKSQEFKARRLAEAVLARDAVQKWELLKNSSRLRIETMDAFSASLVQQLPILSKMGSESRINATLDYKKIAARALHAFAEADPQAIQVILTFWKNDPANLLETVSALLKKRDQWRRFLANALHLSLQQNQAAFCQALRQDRQKLRDYLLAALPELPADFLAVFPRPLALANSESWDTWVLHLLTKENRWRKTLAGSYSEQEKKLIKKTINTLQAQGVPSEVLGKLRQLPSATLPAEHCVLLYALLQLLQLADAELVAHFAAFGESDFSEVAAAAVRALSNPWDAEAPSDILLKLDRRLNHILVDEFQDTSYSQYQLLEKLLSGWQPEDGRTLFLVGDPMQSIYGFREAEVSLFINTFEKKVFAGRPLRAERLTENFRSSKSLVHWYNAVFKRIFPEHSDSDSGAVAFSEASVTVRPAAAALAVAWHFCERNQESQVLLEILQQELKQASPDKPRSIAVLYQKRGQVREVVAQWPKTALRFQGVDLEPLAERPVVRDAEAFCAAWLEPTNSLAAAAVCHSPLVGFTLADLAALQNARLPAADDEAALVFWWQAARGEVLSFDKKQRFVALCQQYAEAQQQRQRQPVVAWLQANWLAAGGLAAVADPSAQRDVLRFWQVLQQRFAQAQQLSLEAIREALAGLYADTQNDSQVQFMTIHKAKGLEFDAVILLGLNRSKKNYQASDAHLIYWQQWLLGDSPLFLLTANHEAQPDGLVPLLQQKDKAKVEQESLRLLYVAVTRAKSQLYLLVAKDKDREKFESQGFIKDLFPSLFEDFYGVSEKKFFVALENFNQRIDFSREKKDKNESAYESYKIWPAAPESQAPLLTETRHLPFTWQPPQFSALPVQDFEEIKEIEMLAEEGESLLPRQLGRVIHRFLWRVAQEGLAAWPLTRLRQEAGRVCWWLQQEGVLPGDLAMASKQVLQALENTLNDPDGRWLFAQSGAAEWAVSMREKNQVRSFIVDRTFIAEGQRFIVDYKTSKPKVNENIEDFFKREQAHYQTQLNQYAKTLWHHDAQQGVVLPLQLALYFPLVVETPRLYAWPYSLDFADGALPL